MGYRPKPVGYASDAHDRRSSVRYETSGTAVVIEWIDGEARHSAAASLKDISLRGALAEMENAPPPGTMILIRLAGEKVKATIIRVSRLRNLSWFPFRRSNVRSRISVSFNGACPYDFFKAAIDGFFVESCVEQRVDPQFDSRDWR